MFLRTFENLGIFLVPFLAIVLLFFLSILYRHFFGKKKSTKRTGRKKAYSKEYLEKSGNQGAKVSDKGTYGEFLAFDVLSKLGYGNAIYPNVYVETNEEETTEIDLLLLTNKCIVSLEIKNYGGVIFGTEKDQYWTQKLSGKSYRLYSPLRQNYAHCAALKKLFPFVPQERIISLVVFNSRCILKVNAKNVIPIEMLRDRINAILAPLRPCFTEERMKQMRAEITKRSKQDFAVKQRHVAAVKQKQKSSPG